MRSVNTHKTNYLLVFDEGLGMCHVATHTVYHQGEIEYDGEWHER